MADVFNALSTKRPNKNAFPLERCFAIIEDGRGTRFDPKVIDAFLSSREAIIKVRMEHADLK